MGFRPLNFDSRTRYILYRFQSQQPKKMAFKDLRKRSLFRPWASETEPVNSKSSECINSQEILIPSLNPTNKLTTINDLKWTSCEDQFLWKMPAADQPHHHSTTQGFAISPEMVSPLSGHPVWCPEIAGSDLPVSARWRSKKQRPKRFQCPHCHVSFSNNGQLKGHVRIHTGERPFACDHPECGKTFTRNEELTRHKRIHSGVRPFPCPLCGKRFGRKDHLKKHVKTHQRAQIIHFPIAPLQAMPYVLGNECLPWLGPF